MVAAGEGKGNGVPIMGMVVVDASFDAS